MPAVDHHQGIDGLASHAGVGLSAGADPALLSAPVPQDRRQGAPERKLLCAGSGGDLSSQQPQPGRGGLPELGREGGIAATASGGDGEELLNFFAVPETHWRKVRTSNVIERAFREVRRRTRPISRFTNPVSCDRIVFGVMSHWNRSWERKPRKEFAQNS